MNKTMHYALPMVRVDDGLSSTDLPAGEFRAGYFVTQGGVSDSPARSGREAPYLELPLLDDGSTDPTDKAKAYWQFGRDLNGGNGRRGAGLYLFFLIVKIYIGGCKCP